MQQKTQRTVQFEITEQTSDNLEAWIEARGLKAADFLFPSRLHTSRTCQNFRVRSGLSITRMPATSGH